ncbi:uncharacterized protein LOC131164451 [Malania oleifera]|uniref:uncharacterized protein LOC131164451 n=1 Tax=Malania oleifera TaxID=397392 RepID=UPI0025AE29C2|nr:uncharacterized protein LOC131164451 [Malania oleifera]
MNKQTEADIFPNPGSHVGESNEKDLEARKLLEKNWFVVVPPGRQRSADFPLNELALGTLLIWRWHLSYFDPFAPKTKHKLLFLVFFSMQKNMHSQTTQSPHAQLHNSSITLLVRSAMARNLL